MKSEHRRVQDVADLSPQQMKVLMGVSSIKLYCLTAHTPQYNLLAARFEDKYLIKTKLWRQARLVQTLTHFTPLGSVREVGLCCFICFKIYGIQSSMFRKISR